MTTLHTRVKFGVCKPIIVGNVFNRNHESRSFKIIVYLESASLKKLPTNWQVQICCSVNRQYRSIEQLQVYYHEIETANLM